MSDHTPLLEAIHLSKSFGKVEALRDINLSIEKQEIFGIIGLSGAGKSTLIRCLAGITAPTHGRVLFKNKSIKIGMIFQHFNLLSSRTVAENVSYPLEIAKVPKEEREKRILELLSLVGLSSKKDLYPATLSGGEKQRVGIARALANHPEILFCDEATSALDPRTTKEILDLLKSINQKLSVTIVLITHDMEVIKRICNRVAVIESGKIVEEGEVSSLFADPEHPTTRAFIQGTSHEIPALFFKPTSPNRKLLRLRFKGEAAGKPVISEMTRQFNIDANILLAWLDYVQNRAIGTLVIELTGEESAIAKALKFLEKNDVHHEELTQ